ncbi:MAG: hypothetical protein ACJA08_000223 [Cyclobacteriaceae bacterium]|jgi:hypothetical protein
MNLKRILLFFGLISALGVACVFGQHSTARKWNDALLEAIRKDFARPTVHARNLFHSSVVMYDIWAIFDPTAQPYMLGKTVHGFYTPFEGFEPVGDDNREKAISYAMHRLLSHRFQKSPSQETTQKIFDDLMLELGLDKSFTSLDYSHGSAAALGNYMADNMIQYGLQDGSNEANEYVNRFYEPVNEPILPDFPGNPDIADPNRWQPIILDVYIDQSGNLIIGGGSPFLSPEWGAVQPFSLTEKELTIYNRDGNDYWVYMDPGSPPKFDPLNQGPSTEQYRWTFSLVSAWSAHLDPNDGVMWDISPGAIGNIKSYPANFDKYSEFYDLENGGDHSSGHTLNPVTNEPYDPQIVPRGDYARVLAEFWADGPDSETPPGHWFTLLNYVSDHPMLVKKISGEGVIVDDLEWDVKAYFMLGGAMHDAAVVAWGIKGYYDYLRPISAIRYMSDQGQCSDPNGRNYDKNGIRLIPEFIEQVEENDALVGDENQHLGKIKLKAWKGPDYIDDPYRDEAGVDWILAENWWPYQRPTFVTPPFSGYISGHSTYSRTAAEVFTLLTGDAFFPGGMGEFDAPKDEFLVFEDGPSVDITLQWATYRDASDQCSLSRIWGGIHPPADDIPGRLIGLELGPQAYDFALQYFEGTVLGTSEIYHKQKILLYPNPAHDYLVINLAPAENYSITVVNVQGQTVLKQEKANSDQIKVAVHNWPSGIYTLIIQTENKTSSSKFIKK